MLRYYKWPVRKSDRIIVNGVERTRGRSLVMWMEAIKHDMIVANLTMKTALSHVEWKKMIHIAIPKVWDKSFVDVNYVDVGVGCTFQTK